MSFIEDSTMSFIDQGSPEEIVKRLLILINGNRYVANKKLKEILRMNGKRYIQSLDVDPDDSTIIEGSIDEISSKSMIRALNRFISGEFAPLNQVKSLIIYLMSVGFIYKFIDEIEFKTSEGEDIKLSDDVTLEDTIKTYYKNLSEKIDKMFVEFQDKYPDLFEGHERTRSYFLNIGTENILDFLNSKYDKDKISDIYNNYVLPIRDLSSALKLPKANSLFDLFFIKKGTYDDNRPKAFINIKHLLPSEQYNSLMSKHIEELDNE